jgi:hypothetical protein
LAPPKEPALSRAHRHRAPDTASSGTQGSGASRHDLSARNRARLLFVLGAVCAALLIAAPLAIVFSDGPEAAGPAHEPEGVFIGGQNPGTGGGTVQGGGGSLATESAQRAVVPGTGAQVGTGNAAAGGAAVAGVPVVAGSGAAAPAGSGAAPAGGGTPAGSNGIPPSGGGAQPATGAGQPVSQQPASQQPTSQQPAAQEPAQQQPAQQQPAPQQPAPKPAPQPAPQPAPCVCKTIGDTLEKVGGTLAPATGAVPLPGLP